MDFNVNAETEEQALINSVRSTLTEQGDALRHLAEVINAEEKMTKHRISTLLITDNSQDVIGSVRIFD